MIIRRIIVSLAALILVIVWVAMHGDSDGYRGAADTRLAPTPRVMAEDDLKRTAMSLGRPIYWQGPLAGYKLVASKARSGTIKLSYVGRDGQSRADVTILSVSKDNSSTILRRLAASKQAAVHKVGDRLIVTKNHGREAYFASSDNRTLVKVYSPDKSGTKAVLLGWIQPVLLSVFREPYEL